METIEKIWNWCETHWQIVAIACLVALILIGPIEQKGRNETNRQSKLRPRGTRQTRRRSNQGGEMSKIKVAFWDELMQQQEQPDEQEPKDGEK